MAVQRSSTPVGLVGQIVDVLYCPCCCSWQAEDAQGQGGGAGTPWRRGGFALLLGKQFLASRRGVWRGDGSLGLIKEFLGLMEVGELVGCHVGSLEVIVSVVSWGWRV